MQHDGSTLSGSTVDSEGSSEVLSEIDARVLGCLMEKQQTTPDQYPLTQNSLVLACNQKSSREPRMSLTDGEVGYCLRELESKGLVKVDMGARTSRYEHRMTMAFNVDKSLQAVLAVMLLRGPQTIKELYTRTQRSGVFSQVEDIENALSRLIERAEPLVKLIPRQPAQREDRYAHLLCGEPKVDVIAAPSIEIQVSGASISAEFAVDLEARIETLESQVVELKNALKELKGP